MKSFNLIAAIIVLGAMVTPAQAQKDAEERSDESAEAEKVVVITGARFLYPLLEHWIDAYTREHRDVQLIIDSRGSADPLHYDILAEAYPPDDARLENRQFFLAGRYAVVPVTHRSSPLAQALGQKGLTVEQVKEIFFDDIFSENKRPVRVPYTPYRRLQKAGVPLVFARQFGYALKDLKGNAVAGADAHIAKALLRDSTGVSFLPLPLAYDINTRTSSEGLQVLSFDLDGNGRVSDGEQLPSRLDDVIAAIEAASPRDVRFLPVEHFHLSIDKSRAKPEVLHFLNWVRANGQDDLHAFGYLLPEDHSAVSSDLGRPEKRR